MDARVRHTHWAVTTAFLDLLREKDIQKISVSDICRTAEINRATFYKYYSSPEDLLGKLEDNHLAELSRRIRISKAHTLDDITKVVLDDVRGNFEFYHIVFAEVGYPDFRKKFINTLHDVTMQILLEYFPEETEKKREWLYSFIMSGAMGVFATWYDNGKVESFDEICDFVIDFVSRNINGKHM